MKYNFKNSSYEEIKKIVEKVVETLEFQPTINNTKNEPLNGWTKERIFDDKYKICHYKNGKLHSVDGLPAIIFSGSYKMCWYKDDKLHNFDGSATLTSFDFQNFYIEGRRYYCKNYDEFYDKVEIYKKRKLKELLKK